MRLVVPANTRNSTAPTYSSPRILNAFWNETIPRPQAAAAASLSATLLVFTIFFMRRSTSTASVWL